MDTVAAYYCFVNFGWPPGEILKYSHREKILILEFIQKDSEARKKAEKEAMAWQS